MSRYIPSNLAPPEARECPCVQFNDTDPDCRRHGWQVEPIFASDMVA